MRIPLRFRLATAISLLLLVFVLGSSVVFYVWEHRHNNLVLTEDGRDDLNTTLTYLQNVLNTQLAKDDRSDARLSLSVTALRDGIKTLLVVDAQDRIHLAHRYVLEGEPAQQHSGYDAITARIVRESSAQRILTRQDGTLLLGYYPVTMEFLHPAKPGGRGVLYVEYDLTMKHQHSLRQTRLTSALRTVVLLLMIVLITAILHKLVYRRVTRLVRVAEQFTAGHLEARAHLGGSDELALLGATLDSMADRRKEVEESLRLYANAFQHSGEAIVVTDSENRIIAVNQALLRLTGYTSEELLGRNPGMLASGRTPPETYQEMWANLLSSDYWQGELWDRRKDGQIYPKWAAISALRNDHGQLTHYIASFTDISERKAAEERIHYLAHHDALTGLFNRYSLEGRLDQALTSARRNDELVALLFIDMDRFKVINDTLGHHFGDRLLIEIASRLRHSVRESDIAARLGGDEFIVALTGLDKDTVLPPLINELLQTLCKPYEIEGQVVHSTPSMGVSLFPLDGADTTALMKNADAALYHAKAQGRNNFQFFAASMNQQAGERLELERDLRRAIEERQFELHYQPQIRASDRKLYGVEALARWRHPDRGLISPLKFIPIAEETGLIVALGEWALDEACRQLAEWRALGVPDLRMAVNLSAHQLRSPNLVDQVRSTLKRHGLRGEDLELEVTESAAMSNPEAAIQQLQALRDIGVDLAIDDFGTGYSSLAYLKLLPIQTLKLDRSFVRDIETDANDAAISAASLALAHSLGLKVVAEGVENEPQRAFLTSHHCDYLQGFLFSKPEPGAHWTELWKAGIHPM